MLLYCAASNKSVIEAIRADYEAAFPTRVQVQYGPSQTLLASAEVSGSGDLYLPADDSYLATAGDRKLIAERFPLAAMRPVIAVAKIWLDGPLSLGLEPIQLVLLFLSALVGVLTVVPGRSKPLQGALHLVLLATFVVVSIQP